ncbi:hypothetical protein D9M73_237740 [compost metagenome]
MHRLVFQAASGCFRAHATFTDDHFNASFFDELAFKFFHAHAGGWPDRHHLEAAIIFLTNNRPSVKNGPALQIHGQLALKLNQATVRHVTAGHQLTGKVNDVTDIEACEIFVLDRGIEDFNHSTTPSWERMS